MLRLAVALALAQVGFHAFIAALPIALVGAGRSNAEIGTIMGTAALVPLVAAFVAGGLIDRYGGGRVFLVGCVSFLVASLLLATGLVDAGSPLVLLLAVRALHGVGLSTILPAAFTLVPGLVPASRLGTALGLVGVGANLSLAISPPVSLAILDATSLHVVAAVAALAVVVATLLVWPVRTGTVSADGTRSAAPRVAPGGRTFRPAWRASWSAPLLVTLLFVAHWGVVTGYLPQRAEAAGADVGLFFTADALGVLALRVPAGYLADRVGSRWLILSGIFVTAGGLALLLGAPSTLMLIAAGAATGAGAAFILPPISLELTRRSGVEDRGSAFALYNVAFSAGIAAGSIGFAPFIGVVGFEIALAAGILACLSAAVVVLADRGDGALARTEPLPAQSA